MMLSNPLSENHTNVTIIVKIATQRTIPPANPPTIITTIAMPIALKFSSVTSPLEGVLVGVVDPLEDVPLDSLEDVPLDPLVGAVLVACEPVLG